MPVTVLAMEVVCEQSGHVLTPMGPNTCITPGVIAGGPGPMVYPIAGSSSSLNPGTNKVLQGGKPTLNAKSYVKTCSGNQPGTLKDIVSFTTAGRSFPFPIPAVTVHFEGAPIAITGNPGMGNCM